MRGEDKDTHRGKTMRGDTSESIYKTMREVSKETSLADILTS